MLTDAAQMCARQTNQTTVVSVFQPRIAQAKIHLVAVVIHIGLGNQFAQAFKTRLVARNQHQAIRLVIAFACFIVLHPHVHPNDGLDARSATRFVKLDHAKQIHQIRYA